MTLPEGLHVDSGLPGELKVKDAQEHVWLTLHDSGMGDPIEWRQTILSRVIDALEISDEDAGFKEESP